MPKLGKRQPYLCTVGLPNIGKWGSVQPQQDQL